VKILIACEYSGVVRDAFIAKGHDARSCDILPTDSPGPHIQGDVLEILNDGWDMMIAHPPCTRLCNSGVRWLHKPPANKSLDQIWHELDEGALLFSQLWNAPIPRIAVENPIMHKYAKERIENFEPASQKIQPWMFGEDASKGTCLWLKGLSSLEPTEIIKRKVYANQTPSGQNKLGPSADRWKERSKTYQGIATAMADQWG